MGIWIVASLSAAEGASLLIEAIGLPSWILQLVVGLALAGMPVAAVVAWDTTSPARGFGAHQKGRPPDSEIVWLGASAARRITSTTGTPVRTRLLWVRVPPPAPMRPSNGRKHLIHNHFHVK